MLIAASYFGLRPLEMLSFRANDEWCDQVTSGIGNHCFSDYQTPMNLVSEPNPWVFGNSFTPTAMVPHVIFNALRGGFIGPEYSLYLFLFLGIIALSFPIYKAFSTLNSSVRIPVALTLSVLSTAGLNGLDRGTSAIFVVPLLYLAAREYLNNNPRKLLIWVTLASFIRPQFIFLAILFLAISEYRYFMKSILIFVSSILIGFMIWPGDRLLHIRSWWEMISGYDEYAASNIDWPINISAGKSLSRIIEYFSQIYPNHSFFIDWNIWVQENFKNLGIFLGFFIFIVAGIFGKRVNKSIVVILTLSAPVLIPGVSWFYYILFLLPIAALLVDKSFENFGILSRTDDLNFLSKIHILLTTSLVLSPLVLPYIDNPTYLSPYDPLRTSFLAQISGPLLFLLVIELLLVGAWQIAISFRPFLLKTR